MLDAVGEAFAEATSGDTDSGEDVVACRSFVIGVLSLTAGPILISMSLDSSEISESSINFAFLSGLMSDTPTEVTAKVGNSVREGGELVSVSKRVLPSTDVKDGNVESVWTEEAKE